MTRVIQKLEEKNIAESFSKFMEYNWEISIPENEMEYPDLLVKTQEGEIGLEIRQLFKDDNTHGSKKKEKERYNQKLLAKLSNKYYQQISIPILVKIYGNIENNFENILTQIIKNSNGDIYKTILKKIYSPHGLISIYITRLPEKFNNFSEWQNISDNIGFVRDINSEYLNKIIKDKSKNIPKYLRNINNVSLLLYSDYLFNSGKIRFSKKLDLKKNGFQNIFVYEHLIYGEKY